MTEADAMIEWLKEPRLYTFAERITTAKEKAAQTSGQRVVSIHDWHLGAARKELAERYRRAITEVDMIEYTAKSLRRLHERKTKGRFYQRHDIEQTWEQWQINGLESAVYETELDKEPRLAFELGAIKSAHIIKRDGNLHAFSTNGYIKNAVVNSSAGAAIMTVGAGYAISMADAPVPANFIAAAGEMMIVLVGGVLIDTNLGSLHHIRTINPFMSVATTLEQRAAYIKNALK
jgi:hypothetical protein